MIISLENDIFPNISSSSIEHQKLIEITDICSYRKKEFLKHRSEPKEYMFYIQKGLVRSFLKDNDDTEINIAFGFENSFVCDPGNFFGKCASKMQIQALEDTTVLRIEKNKFHFLAKKYKKIDDFGKNLLLNQYNVLMDKEVLLKRNPSETLYKMLMEKDGYYLNRIPIKYMADYLGIHPNSLSRIRKQMKNTPKSVVEF